MRTRIRLGALALALLGAFTSSSSAQSFEDKHKEKLQKEFAKNAAWVLDLDEASQHPLFDAREMITEVPTPGGGTQRQMAAAIKFSTSVPSYKRIGAALGEHTEDVLRELGKSDADIERLAKEGCFS